VFYVRGEGLPVERVVVMGMTPVLTLMVAKRLKDQIQTLRDLKGMKIVIGHSPRSGKSMIGCWLPRMGGVPLSDFTAVKLTENDYDRADQRRHVAEALRTGAADFVMAQEPDAGIYQAGGVASVFADLTSVEETKKNLGTLSPSTALYMANSYVKAQPQTAQRLVKAFDRSLKFINSHTPEQLMDVIPREFVGRDGATYLRSLRHEVPMFATDGFMPDDIARNAMEIVTYIMPEYKEIPLKETYTNEFAQAALRKIR
jgi:NitT/TauT family transport system substrate-binding protein